MKPAPTAMILCMLALLNAPFLHAQPASSDTPQVPPMPIGFDSNAVHRPLPPPVQPRFYTPPVRVPPPGTSPAGVVVTPAINPPGQVSAGELAFDAASKRVTAKAGDPSASFTFGVTNVSDQMVTINQVRTSCGCTAAHLPVMPWRIAPGDSGSFGVTMNIAGKHGIVTKTVTIFSSAGTTNLLVTSEIAGDEASSPGMMDRLRNQRLAAANRQAVFQGDCATCHVQPTVGKMGVALYDTACGICHDAEHRASMVPDLHNLPQATNTEYWHQFVAHGKPGTLMPAFAKSEQGPLTDDQIESLVDYLSINFKPGKSTPNAENVQPHLPDSTGGH